MGFDLTWDSAEDIAIELSEKYPELDPLTVRFTDLHQYVTGLPNFKDDPMKSNEAKLEASRWHGTRNTRNGNGERRAANFNCGSGT